MFQNILAFELKMRFKKISTYLYFFLFLAIGFFAMWRGSFGSGLLSRLTNAGIGNVMANAPYALHYFITFISNYGILLVAVFFGKAAHKDFKEEMYPLYFSYPISKFNYLSGRFCAAFIHTSFILFGVGIGTFLASVSPVLTNPDKIGTINILAYLNPYFINVLPNILVIGSLFFTLVLISRKYLSVNAGMIIVLVIYLFSMSLMANQDSRLLASLIDPFGHFAARGFYDYWSAAQKNSLLIPFYGNLFLNRIIWTTVGMAALIFAYKKFQFSQVVESRKRKSLNQKKKKIEKTPKDLKSLSFNKTSIVFNLKNYVNQTFVSTFKEFRFLTKNVYFLIILAIGITFIIILGFRNVGIIRGTQTFPLTFQILDTTKISFYLFNLIVILFCSGELVWRERNKKVQDIYDVLPVPEWVPYLSKLGSLILIQILLITVVLFCGILIQVLHGYYHFEIGLYIKELFGIRLPYFIFISIFAVFIQVLVNKKIFGYIITVLFVDDFMPAIGLEHHFWRFAKAPGYIYSDMNGYSPYFKAILFYDLYWFFLCLILIVLTMLLWIKGKENRIKDRLKTARLWVTKPKKRAAQLGFAGCFIFGGFVLFNTNVINEFKSSNFIEKKQVEYEKQYGKYRDIPQPHITDINVNVDIFPKERKVNINGSMILVNKTGKLINEIFVEIPEDVKINKLHLNQPFFSIEPTNGHKVYILKLNSSLHANEQINFTFDLERSVKGFKNHGQVTRLVKNGTFIPQYNLMPAIGYDSYLMNELSDNDKRKKYGLPPKKRIPSLDDELAKMYTPIGKVGTWINIESIISTDEDQIAIAPGDLIKEWNNDNRRYFHYKSNGKMLRYYAFLSGEYKINKNRWKDVDIEVYFHESHNYNIDLMIDAAKKSLNYFTQHFGPYQFKSLKIVEFPRYSIFAEGFPGLIPISEGYGFIAKYEEDKVKEVFRVVAHEVAHQWWGHQVIGANVEGMFLLSEMMAQYSALMVIKNEYEKKIINKYLKFEIDRYLRGRGRETREEVPLLKTNMSTWYINYAKGMVVMNALQDYIGEENLNKAIRKYVQKVAYQEAPFTTSLEWFEYIKATTPDSLKYVLTDMFQTITLYENKAKKATCKKLNSGKYKVILEFEVNKIRADELGNETSIEPNDFVTFGAFDENGNEIYLQKHWVNSGMKNIEFMIDEIPAKVGIDPYYYLIDKNVDDNVISIENLK